MSGESALGAEPVSSRVGIGHKLLRLGEAWALVALTGAMVVFFSLYPSTSDSFPQVANFQVLGGSQAVPALAALAVLIPLICNEIDLSVGANLGLSSVLVAYALGHGVPLAGAVLIGIGVGVLVGTVNGVLVAGAEVSGVVVTLGMMVIVEGVVLAVTDAKGLFEGIPSSLTDFGTHNVGGVPRIALAALLAAALVYYVLAHTPLGRQLYMLGANRRAALLVGLAPRRLLAASFVLSGALAGLAGVLLVGRTGGADPRAGPPFTLTALTAAFLSAAAIRPGHFNVGGVITAIGFLAVLNSGLNHAGAAPYLSQIVNGVALIGGVALAAYLGRKGQSAA